MLLSIIILTLFCAAIAYSIIFAAFELIKTDKKLKSVQHSVAEQKKQTLSEIQEILTTCKTLKNADSRTQEQILSELTSIRKWLENKYY